LGYHITFVTSKSLNFAQGTAMMLGAVAMLMLYVDVGLPYFVAAAGSLAVLAIFGLALERTAVRPFVGGGSVGWVLSTLAVGIVIENAVQLTFGKTPRGMARSLVDQPITIFGAGLYPQELIIPAVVLALAVVARFLYGNTMIGRGLRATAF